MQPLKFYIAVAGVGALSDFALNTYLSGTTPTSEVGKGLKGFYSGVHPVKAMLLASVTFVAVVFIADLIVTGTSKK